MDEARVSVAERASTCLKARWDYNSYQDFIWAFKEESSTTHIHSETTDDEKDTEKKEH